MTARERWCASISCAQARVLLLELALRPTQREMRADAREQLARLERLGEVVDAAGGERAHLLERLVERGQEDHRHVAGRFVRLEPLAHGEAVEVRHHHVEQHEVRRVGAGALEALGARAGGDHVETVDREQVDEQLDVRRRVVDDQDPRRGHAAPSVRRFASAAATAPRNASMLIGLLTNASKPAAMMSLAVLRHDRRGERDHRDRARRRRRAELRERLDAADPRQVDVHHDEIGCALARERHAVLAGLGLDRAVAVDLQQVARELAVLLVVLDDQDQLIRHGGWAASR